MSTDKLAVVFGCGGDRDKGKRPQMGAIAAKLADIAYVTDDNPRSEDPATIRAEIMAACPGGIEIGDRAKAIRAAVDALAAGDVLLVAGKGHEDGPDHRQRRSCHSAITMRCAPRSRARTIMAERAVDGRMSWSRRPAAS